MSVRPRLRVTCGAEIALGPGRVDLLEHIAEAGILRSAAAQMDMSYMRAWTIVKSLNEWFRTPLVEVARGGKRGGGARLTLAGRKVVASYRRMEKQSQRAVKGTWEKLRGMLIA
jgi:molybdate transport system regulatory protein